MSKWIGLVSPQGCTEVNARFFLGNEKAKSLEHGKFYTEQDLGIKMPLHHPQATEKNIKKWRCEKHV